MSEVAEDEVVARAAWSRLVEPGDPVAGALVGAMGPVEALAWLRDAVAVGDSVRVAPPKPAGPADGPSSATAVGRLRRSVARWAPRLPHLDPERDVDRLRRLGGHLVVPGSGGWPTALDALAEAAPPCLWVLGQADLRSLLVRAVALIGARACTAYGEHVTAEIGAGIAGAGWTVVSGGAYGIDAVAHRSALAGAGPTVAVLAGGVDRPYPAGNARLLAAVAAEGGALVSEVPPGSVPTRSRFLQRNRVIAAAGATTVVVEAAWRSGALNTAGHAAELLRPVGAVPGPVTSAASAGCHRLLREGSAVCVTDTADVLELAGDGAHALTVVRGEERVTDGLPIATARTLEALPVRRPADVESLTRAAGLALPELQAALGTLELAGLAEQTAGRWRRARERGDPDTSAHVGRTTNPECPGSG